MFGTSPKIYPFGKEITLTDIMTINYKGYIIKISLYSHDPNVHYNVWTPQGGFLGFFYTMVQSKAHIDAVISLHGHRITKEEV